MPDPAPAPPMPPVTVPTTPVTVTVAWLPGIPVLSSNTVAFTWNMAVPLLGTWTTIRWGSVGRRSSVAVGACPDPSQAKVTPGAFAEIRTFWVAPRVPGDPSLRKYCRLKVVWPPAGASAFGGSNRTETTSLGPNACETAAKAIDSPPRSSASSITARFARTHALLLMTASPRSRRVTRAPSAADPNGGTTGQAGPAVTVRGTSRDLSPSLTGP